MEILLREISSIFCTAKKIRLGILLSSYNYLHAYIDVAMRLSPGVGGILSREVMRGSIRMNNYYFPSGTILGTPCYIIYYHLSDYPSLFLYQPERWLINKSEGVNTESVALV